MKKKFLGLGILIGLIFAVSVYATSAKIGYGIFTAMSGTQYVNDDSIITRTMNMRPYQVDEASATVTYMRYQGGAGVVLLIKIGVADTITTFEKSYDTWANRATATYIPVNDWN
jgi:hypothetical protein